MTAGVLEAICTPLIVNNVFYWVLSTSEYIVIAWHWLDNGLLNLSRVVEAAAATAVVQTLLQGRARVELLSLCPCNGLGTVTYERGTATHHF